MFYAGCFGQHKIRYQFGITGHDQDTLELTDGRLVFGPDVAELMLRRFQGDIATFEEAVARFHTVLLLWPTNNLPERDPERWRRLYADDVASVWVAKPAWERVGLGE